MISGICKGEGKHPKGNEESWVYYPPGAAIPQWSGDECARLKAGFVKFDYDDFDKKTGEPIHLIRGERGSDVIKRILDAQKIRYNLLLTERGKHFYFRLPDGVTDSKKINWQTAIGIEAEFHPGEGTAKTHIPYKVNGVLRQWVVGGMTNEDIDYLPCFLYPLQKSKEKPFDLNFPRNDRTQKLGAYLFHLVNKGFTAEQAFGVVRLMNEYIFEEPIPPKTLDAEILNDSTLKKLMDGQKEKADKNISHSDVAQEIIDRFHIITVHGRFYNYNGGVYKLFDDGKITQHMTEYRPKLNGNFEKEVIRHIKGKTYHEYPQDDGTVNIRNGILSFSADGTPTLLPHSQDYISFKQFNAIYDPGAQCKLLDETLFKWFSGDNEQIELLNQVLGYLLMNHVRYHKVFFFVGIPGTGKSTVLNLIRHFCGVENVSAIQLDDMGKTFGLASIVHKTANIFSDLKKTKVLASDTFKMLSDGSPLKINEKFKPEFTYCYTGKLLFGMNRYPDFSSDLDGVERRVTIFTFKHLFHKDTPDYNPTMLEDLSTDECMSALLNRAVSGYKTITSNKGFSTTKESNKALNEFVSENNNVVRWLYDAEITTDYLLREPIKNGFKGLYPEYCAYCLTIGETAKAQKDFTRDICEKYGFEASRKRIGGERLPIFRKK
jgi:putative DNA primase/helicase